MLAAYHGRLGRPMVFSRSLFEPLAALRGDKAAWKLRSGRAASPRRQV